MDINEAKQVLDDYKKGVATLDQIKMVENWYMAISREQELNSDEANFSNVEDNIWEAILKRTGLAIEQPNHHISKLWPRLIAAASIVIVIAAGGFYFYKNYDATNPIVNSQHDIAPGGNKAFLTLSNGKRITLTDAKTGELAEQSGVKITKAADGQLIYTVSSVSNQSNKINAYNTIETPRGGTYQVRLPDGTKVWLNAASTIKYPVSFSSRQARRVLLLSGEAYFEVSKDKKHPFIVQTDQQEVKVLGTHFNINNYKDESSVKTTLLEGSIIVNNQVILKPGEQATNNTNNISIKTVDINAAVDWKNNDFILDGESFGSIMRKISRWYDVQIIYDHPSPETIQLGGWISRNSNISAILKRMESTGKVHFKVQGRRVTITK